LYSTPSRAKGVFDGNKRIAFATADVFLRRNGFFIDVKAQAGYEFICGSMERHEFRFAQIAEWIRENIQPVAAGD
jgi:death on curing protein